MQQFDNILDNIFESMTDMVYVNSKDYEIKQINKAVANKLGLPPAEIVGRKCYEVFHCENRPSRRCSHYKALDTKKAFLDKVDNPHLGGTFLKSSSPIFDSEGELIGSVHVMVDITEIQELEEKLHLAEKRAVVDLIQISQAEASAEFQLIIELVHELNPRIGALKSILKHLQHFIEVRRFSQENLQEQFYEGQQAETVQEAISKAMEELSLMSEQLKETRQLITEEMLPYHFELVDLNKLFRDSIIPRYNSDTYSIEFKSSLSSPVLLHKLYFMELIETLIRNGIMHGLSKTRTHLKMFFWLSEDEDGITLDYANDGEPWPEEMTKDKFLSFGEKGKDSPGTGIGGAFIDKIIRPHHGQFHLIQDSEYSVHIRIVLPKRKKNE